MNRRRLKLVEVAIFVGWAVVVVSAVAWVAWSVIQQMGGVR